MDLSQDDVRRLFEELGSTNWTIVRDSWSEEGVANGGIYSAFAPPSERPRALSRDGWDISVGDFRPGFSQGYEDGKKTTTYHPAGSKDLFEPLILVRQYYGVVPSQVEITEHFRLYHNLYWDELTSQFMQPLDDGTSLAAIRIEGKKVEVRTKLLRQYQAARQLDLYFFIDSVRFEAVGTATPPKAHWSNDLMRTGRFPGEIRSSEKSFTRYLGKRVLEAPPIEKAGIWPFEPEDDHFPEFIIGTDNDGDEVRYTCNPDALANYFGANPDAPHYLTPVHFRRDVLQKYYDNPDLYEVTDGRLSCAALWGVQIDNSATDSVVVFLGDLGRDLPRAERDYWRSFNVPPDGPMSETLLRRAILGQFFDTPADDLQVRSKYISLGRAWHERFGWGLFRKPEEADAGLLQRLRLPLNESQAEVESSVRIMTQLVIDALNEAKIQEGLSERRLDEKGISKFERWLAQEGYPHARRDVQFLRNLQQARSEMTAHRKGSGYEKMLTKIFGELRGSAAIRTFFESALMMLMGLEEWISTLDTGSEATNSD